MNNAITIPGVFVSILEHGCLITGNSNIGKSELALSLIDRGHALVSDDVTEFVIDQTDTIIGRAPLLLRNRLHIRDLGVLDIPALFGEQATRKQEKLSVIIALQTKPSAAPPNPLIPTLHYEKILDKSIPKLNLTTNKHRELALILETFVKSGILSQSLMHPASGMLHEHQQQLGDNQQ